MRASSLKIGQILISTGAITPEQLEAVLSRQKTSPKRLGELLIDDKIINEEQLCKALAKQFSIEYVNLETIEIDPRLSEIVKEDQAIANMILPLSVENRTLTIAISDPLDYKAINNIATYTRLRVNAVIAEPAKIRDKHRELYTNQKAYDEAREFISSQTTKGAGEDLDAAKTATEDQPIIRFVNSMIEEAVRLKASDIHIEPMEKMMVVRFRIDGKLQKYLETSAELAPSVISRIKYICGMNIAEKRVPQDGRINYKINGIEIDMRISSLPSVYGEKIVIRITTALGLAMDKTQIGFLPDNLQKFEQLLESNRGIILLTGATGSGKSTTLYTALKEVMREDNNIVTVENPVEMIIPGITQVDINDKAGLTFSGVLRSILRQDPDIIMIGEIRDRETAEIAASAAITGHLVLSTLHTYNAASTVVRLVDMGVAPFMVTSAVIGVVSQRLVRRLCVNCRQAYEASDAELKYLGLPLETKKKLYRASPKGCEKCNKSGHRGRIAVHEVMMINSKIKNAIHHGESTEALNNLAIQDGMIPMRENLRLLTIGGTISVETMAEAAAEDEVV